MMRQDRQKALMRGLEINLANSRVSHLISRLSFGLLAAFAFTGCGHIEPWVKPYERAALADSVMDVNRNPVSGSYLDHVHEVREASRGATGGAGGGCGCN